MATDSGPFEDYVPPGVYTKTLSEANLSSLVATPRIPVMIGVGQEELLQTDVEIIRGSSSTVDQQIVNEDVTLAWVVDATNPNNLILGAQTGLLTTFRVRNYPMVDGQGIGRVTNDTRAVTVTVNGIPVALGGVNGSKGLVTLQIPTQPNDVVRCTYFFHRGDTSFTDDLSDQITGTLASLITPGFQPFDVTTGSNDTFTFKVNGTLYTATLPGGGLTAAAVKAVLDALLITNFSTSTYTDGEGKIHVQLNATQEIEVQDGNANGILGFTNFAKTTNNAVFTVYQRPIVDGTGSGATTTDTSKVVVKVNNVQVIPTAVDGVNGTVTLALPPAMGSTITVTYWSNTWQDTFDYMPNTLVTSVLRAGISPGRADYIEGQDFVVVNQSSDVSVVHWGTSWSVNAATTTAGATPFDETQVTGQLVDEKMYLGECTRLVDTTVIPATISTTQFLLPEVPTTGNGRDTTLGDALFASVTNTRQDLVTNRPDLVVIRVGRNLRDALGRPAVKVVKVDGASRLVTLKDPVPPDWLAFATFYYNRIGDDTFILTNKVAGPVGSGQYEVFSTTLNTNLLQTRFGTKTGLSQIVQWPRGVEQIPDAFHTGDGTPVSETVTVTFANQVARNAAYTIKGAQSYNFFSPSSATWVTKLNGSNYTTNLATARPATLVSGHVTPIQTGIDTGKITITAGINDAFNVKIDGTSYPVTLTAGNRTSAQILTDVNTAVGSAVMTTVQIGPITGDHIFVITSTTTPAALPAGFDSVSTVEIEQGTAEGTLGYAAFQAASGSSGAINKPATLLGSLAGPFNITAGLNDTFKVKVDGTDYQVTLTAGAAVPTATIAADINAVPGLAGVGSVGTLANLDKLRLTSTTNNSGSNITILDGNANTTLGFAQNDTVGNTPVLAQEVVNSLMNTVGFAAAGVAYPNPIDGQTYITIESITTGLTTSSVAFVTSANSAFNVSTGVQITPGVDGDSGEDAQQIFNVTSDNPAGSSGSGIPGQTYTDSKTGLRFSVLPASVGSYTTGGSFTLLVSSTFKVDPSRPFYAIPGLETTVSNTVGVGLNDTASLQTFNPGGVEPSNGSSYYISYRFMKQDFSTRIFRQLKSVEANYGPVAAENRVSLAAYLAMINGAVLVGVKQVLKVPNTAQASDASFIAAIQELDIPLPGNIRPDILVPLATTTPVYSFLTQDVEVQSDPKHQSERMGFIGFAAGTTPSSAQAIARALVSNRIVAFYPDSAVITLTDELGQNFEQLVDGTNFAAAVAGSAVSPSLDVATPFDRRRIQGFTRVPRVLDPVEANQTAVAGITILEDLDPVIRIRHALTTNMATILTRTPSVTQIIDHVQQQSRLTLDPFIGVKFLPARLNDMVQSMSAMFRSLQQAEIITAWKGVTAVLDPNSVVSANVAGMYSPVLPLQYIPITLSIRTRL